MTDGNTEGAELSQDAKVLCLSFFGMGALKQSVTFGDENRLTKRAAKAFRELVDHGYAVEERDPRRPEQFTLKGTDAATRVGSAFLKEVGFDGAEELGFQYYRPEHLDQENEEALKP